MQTDHKLTWNDHIQYTTHKATQINGFLYRNLSQCPPPCCMYVCLLQCRRTALPSTGVKINQSINQSINPHVKTTCYKLMVRPILEYAASVWDPYTNINIQALESVQRCAARFCLGDYSRYSSVTSMLLLLGLPSLQSRRKLAKLTITYKIINGYLHIPSNSLIPNHRDSRDGCFTQLQCRTDSYKFSFSPSTIKLRTPFPPL